MPADPAEAEGAEGSNAAPAPSRPAPTKVAYHPNVRCLRGGGGKGKFEGLGFDPSWPHPVIVRPMYRVGEGYVCEQKATEEEKANGPVEPAQDDDGNMVNPVLEGFDLRGWAVADIQGLRGADGKLDLEGAILCGVDLRRAQLQGADLTRAQLQGAGLRGAQLQGADLGEAQLQGADLRGAQLQGAYLPQAQLQGADLREAQLQGARLYEAQLQAAYLCGAQLQGAALQGAQLQGADLREADLSVLPKDFPLPKRGAAGETEATKEGRPTTLECANLSVLPKGSKYNGYDAAQPTNLTDAKASGADFTRADLRGATFTAATLSKDATLKDATFAPFRLPERPASGALHGTWRAKALLGSMARAAIAAADDDDDDSDGASDDGEEEEESPVKAKTEQAIDAVMDRLAAAA